MIKDPKKVKKLLAASCAFSWEISLSDWVVSPEAVRRVLRFYGPPACTEYYSFATYIILSEIPSDVLFINTFREGRRMTTRPDPRLGKEEL